MEYQIQHLVLEDDHMIRFCDNKKYKRVNWELSFKKPVRLCKNCYEKAMRLDNTVRTKEVING